MKSAFQSSEVGGRTSPPTTHLPITMDPKNIEEAESRERRDIPPPPSFAAPAGQQQMTQRRVYEDSGAVEDNEEEEEYTGPVVGRLTPEKQALFCKRMYFGGFAFLPLLWVLNYILFYPILSAAETSPEVKKYSKRSLIGASIVFPVIIAWIFVYQFLWNTWGVAGELISVVIPKG